MSIVKMKKLRIIALRTVRHQLLKDLTRLGCVEIERSDAWLTMPELSGIMEKLEEETTHSQVLSDITSALTALQTYADVKKGLFQPAQEIKEQHLYDREMLGQAKNHAREINEKAKEISDLQSGESKYKSQKEALLPWSEMDIPLDFNPTGKFSLNYGICPASVDVSEMKKDLEEKVKEAELTLVHADKEQQYLVLVTHSDVTEEALELCKEKGFSITSLKGIPGTVADNIKALEERIENIHKEKEQCKEKIVAKKDAFEILGVAHDSLSTETQRKDILSATGNTKQTINLQGWVPYYSEKKVAEVLEANGCAYEFCDPAEDEEPPVMIKNNGFVRPFQEITNLYGVPGALSLIDPSPFVAVSYFIFFGLMFSDTAYGLILVIIGTIVLKKAKPTGAFANFMWLAVLVGISTTLWGLFFGSFFGDIIPVVTERITGTAWIPPKLMDPLVDPITMLIMSLAIGVVHIFIGMGLSVYRQFKQGQWKDAVFDTMIWYVVVIGILLFILGIEFALWAVIAALVIVVITAGRDRKGIGKFTAAFGALYNNLTGFLSDILSYSRLMALSMATGVVASVFNTLGNMFGTSAFGWIMLVVIFAIGQVFNFAINLLGAFVHSCRLEYVEFFGKFFEGGGHQFKPLFYNTKYTYVRRENS